MAEIKIATLVLHFDDVHGIVVCLWRWLIIGSSHNQANQYLETASTIIPPEHLQLSACKRVHFRYWPCNVRNRSGCHLTYKSVFGNSLHACNILHYNRKVDPFGKSTRTIRLFLSSFRYIPCWPGSNHHRMSRKLHFLKKRELTWCHHTTELVILLRWNAIGLRKKYWKKTPASNRKRYYFS